MRSASRPVLVPLCLFAFAFVLSACGDEGSQSLTFELKDSGKGTTFSAPETAEPGLAEITLVNESKSEGDLQLIRVEGEHSADEVVQGLGAAMQGKPFPAWFYGGGGTGTTSPGESRAVTQVLKPGTYFAFNTEGGGAPDPKTVTSVEVSGDASDQEVEGDSTISGFEYGFEGEGLSSDSSEIVFENKGAQPHHLIASRLIGDSTAKDVEKFFKTEKGKPPLQEKGTQSTAVIEGGESQLVDLDLKPGRYVLYCFITDRQGGPPHAFKGMVDEVEVK